MQRLVVRFLLFLNLFSFILIGCTRNDSPSQPPTVSSRTFNDSVLIIVAKWAIIKDSSTNTGFSYPSCGTPMPGIYIGIPGDYCDFNIDGKVYIFGNAHLVSAPYQILPGKISFFDCGTHEASIQFLSETRLTLFWSLSNSNGRYTRTLYLKK